MKNNIKREIKRKKKKIKDRKKENKNIELVALYWGTFFHRKKRPS
jgi:hypothetical protein